MFRTLLLLYSVCSLVAGFHPVHSSVSCRRTPSSSALWGSLTIYGHPGTRSPLVYWGCYELGLTFELGDLAKNPHPFGQLPCLTDDDNVLVFESGAILQYLLLTQKDLPMSTRAAIVSWITWANASLDPICFLETPQGKVYDTGLRQPNKKIDKLDSILADSSYLVTGEFTLADVAVASYLLYVLQFFSDVNLARWPNIVRYLQDCVQRPTYGQAFGERVQTYLIQQLEQMKPQKTFGLF